LDSCQGSTKINIIAAAQGNDFNFGGRNVRWIDVEAGSCNPCPELAWQNPDHQACDEHRHALSTCEREKLNLLLFS
jgi:hypothetical protein